MKSVETPFTLLKVWYNRVSWEERLSVKHGKGYVKGNVMGTILRGVITFLALVVCLLHVDFEMT